MLVGILIAAVIFGPPLAGRWHPSDKDYPVQGIDVSHHQGPIDWLALPSQGVDFAYIKATEGGDHVDRRFAANWRAASAAGIRRGAYHFFTLCRSGAEQAANFVRTVPVEPNALPPAVDLEYLGNCNERPKLVDVHKELTDFLRIVESRYGRPTILYLTEEFDEGYGISKRFDQPLWLRNLVFQPHFGGRPWTIWQVSNFRRLRGIDGRVDWNVASLDFTQSAPPIPRP